MSDVLTPPEILPLVPLVMNPLLNQLLVFRIVRVQDLHRLPPPLALVAVAQLKRCRRHQHRQRQALRVHTRLHQLLRAGQIRVPADQRERGSH